jgi:hypothetical protein
VVRDETGLRAELYGDAREPRIVVLDKRSAGIVDREPPGRSKNDWARFAALVSEINGHGDSRRLVRVICVDAPGVNCWPDRIIRPEEMGCTSNLNASFHPYELAELVCHMHRVAVNTAK